MKKAYDPFLRVLVNRSGRPLRAEVVENTLRSMQELVGGLIECVTITTDLALVCNEEGRLRESDIVDALAHEENILTDWARRDRT